MGKPTLLQAFAQNSTMAIDPAKLLAGDAIQALNHKDLNGGARTSKTYCSAVRNQRKFKPGLTPTYPHTGDHFETICFVHW
jgi:hypothetical protein